ncbi:MAG: fumarylacetoacetate hydrolase family protein [Planctomycetales bacterium]|nr:fumarylacetoacetate hydrolase family protein [Planctomycetales bacterium]
MHLCRFQLDGHPRCGILAADQILPLDDVAAGAGEKQLAEWLHWGEPERLMPIDSDAWQALLGLVKEVLRRPEQVTHSWIKRASVQLLPPISRPPKLLLLAGNYAAHVREQGDVARERSDTFPYVFMKPPSTTLVGDGTAVKIPESSPHKIDHEVELAVIIGKRGRQIPASAALEYVAGYTIINDLSDRGFRPNPDRIERPRDKFFDWLHGKWHDGFCPCGPCMVTSDDISDPQQLALRLTVDGETRQEGTTADQVFSVAEVIEFISNWLTLEPGDIISTGTPAGVGNASGLYLQPGQKVCASIDRIGQLHTPLI